MKFKCLGMNSSWLEWDLSCGRRHEQQWRWGENKTNENAKTQILDAELNWWIFQPTYNYCKFYEPKLVEGVCSFNKDNVIDCAPDAEFTFAPFNMDSSVATENNMVGIFIFILPHFANVFHSILNPRQLKMKWEQPGFSLIQYKAVYTMIRSNSGSRLTFGLWKIRFSFFLAKSRIKICCKQ